MNLGIVGKAASAVGKTLIKNSPAILTGVGVMGVGMTAVATGQAVLKAEGMIKAHEMDSELLVEGEAIFDEEGITEKKPCRFRERTKLEKVKLTWKCFIPPMILGLSTAACILGAHTIDTRRRVALAAAYSISEEAAKEFRDKVTDTIGEKKVRKIDNEIMQDKVNDTPMPDEENIIFTGKGDQLMYDSWSGRYFKSGQMQVEKAVLLLNKRMAFKKESVSVNEYYEEIGLPYLSNTIGEEFGWNYHLNNDGEDIVVDFYPVFSNNQTPCIGVKIEPELMYTYGEV